MAAIYTKVYRIPELAFDAKFDVYLWAVVVSLIAALLGAAQAVLRAARLPPAAALAPPAPVSFGRLGQGIENAARNLDGKSRMVARRIARFPRRSATTVIGVMLALALLDHLPAFSDLDESHRRRDVRRRAADGRDADVRGNGGRSHLDGSRVDCLACFPSSRYGRPK